MTREQLTKLIEARARLAQTLAQVEVLMIAREPLTFRELDEVLQNGTKGLWESAVTEDLRQLQLERHLLGAKKALQDFEEAARGA